MSLELTRRKLDFRDFDAVLAEVDALAARGYDKAGNWDLAQVCRHLADWLRFPIDGYPKPPAAIRFLLWAMKHSVGKRQLRAILDTRSFPVGGPTMPETVAAPGGDTAEAVKHLRHTVGRFRQHQGTFYSSPLFGDLDRDAWNQLQFIHCAHHLSFLVPRT